MKFSNKKKIILGSIIGVLIGTLVSVSYAFFTYTNTGTNSSLVTGDIYMRYKESSTTININDMMPRSTKPNDYFEFTVEGTNTTEDKDIIYDINIIHGDDYDDGDNDDSNDKVRIRDEFLRFTLMEKIGDGEWTTPVNAKKYSDFSQGLRMWVNQINRNTTSKVTHTYRLYVWIDESVVISNTKTRGVDYTTSEWNNLFASVKVNVTGDFTDKQPYRDPLHTVIRQHLTTANSDTDSDNITYISGCSDEAATDTDCTDANKINFNFVWYSGKLWRVTAIYPSGEMKLITENPITTIYWGADNNYGTSWVKEWLNEDFKDTLANQNNVLISGNDNFYWNAKPASSTTKQAKETTYAFTDSVGLLDAYEYTESYKKASNTYSNGYLNINQEWWLITPNSSSPVVYNVSTDGNGSFPYHPLYTSNGIRPSIYLKSTVTFASGNGTRNNPYRIGEDISAPTTNANIYTRVSGEYVTFKDELFRIVDTDTVKNTTKIVKADYLLNGNSVLNKKIIPVYGTGTGDTWDNYLNNTWLTQTEKDTYLVQDNYYLGEYGSPGTSYKKTICDTTNNNTDYSKTTKTCDKLQNSENATNIYTGYVGLLRVGEMFSSQLKTSRSEYLRMWLITPFSSTSLGIVWNGSYSNGGTDSYAVRPSVTLKSNIIITGGDGTEQHPFEIALGSE